MTALEIGKELVSLGRQGKNREAIDKLYSPDIVSVEAMEMPNIGQTQQGLEAVKGKNTWWEQGHGILGRKVDGPYPNGNQFIVHFQYDVTPKHTGTRTTVEEMGLYTVENGRNAKEEFFDSMGC